MADSTELSEKRDYQRLSEHQLDAMAILCVEGVGGDEIARQVGVPREQVLAIIRGGRNQKFDKLLEGYKKKVLQSVMGHRFRLMDLLDDAYLAIDNAINNGDSKLRAETSWKLFEQVVPRPKDEQDHSLKIVINNPTVQAEMGKTINHIHESLDEMVDVLKHSDEDKHVLIGDEALPTPPVQLEISDAEALPSEEEADKNLDLEVLDD
jgi:hypothetical protein